MENMLYACFLIYFNERKCCFSYEVIIFKLNDIIRLIKKNNYTPFFLFTKNKSVPLCKIYACANNGFDLFLEG